jgi:hypothetical protein
MESVAYGYDELTGRPIAAGPDVKPSYMLVVGSVAYCTSPNKAALRAFAVWHKLVDWEIL